MKTYVWTKLRSSPICQLNVATSVNSVDQQKNCPVNSQNKDIVVVLRLLIIRMIYYTRVDN